MKNQTFHRLRLEALEERLFFDANPAAVGFDAIHAEPLQSVADAEVLRTAASIPPESPQSTEPVTAVDAGQTAAPETSPQAATPEAGIPPPGMNTGAESASPSVLTTINPETIEPAVPNTDPETSAMSASPADSLPEQNATTTGLSEQTLSAGDSTDQLTNSTESPGIADPSATSQAIDPMIGENFTFTVTLDNPNLSAGNTLYGPYIDLYFESAGDDGDGDGIIFGDNSGSTANAAKYLGASLNTTVLTYDGVTPLLHPYAVDSSGLPLGVSTRPDGSAMRANDTLVVIEMPFGSFTPDQPAAQVTITAHISPNAYIDATGANAYDLDVQVANGFRYGLDSLDNPGVDPSYTYLDDIRLVHATQTFRPEVVRFNKVYIGPENETATGPNYVRQYRIDIDVAEGQTVTNLQLVEKLPDSIWYMGDTTVTGGTVSYSPGAGVFSGEQLIIDIGSLTGVAGVDHTITFDYYVPYVDSIGQIIVLRDDGSGNDDTRIINDVEIRCDWIPTDLDDAPISIVMDAEVDGAGNISTTPDNDEEFFAKALAIQKDVSFAVNTGTSGYNPGDIVSYTLNFQVSDYFNVGNILVTDILPDGLDFLTAAESLALFGNTLYQPIYNVEAYGITYSGAWSYGANLSETVIAGDDMRIVFDVSNVSGVTADGILRGTLSDAGDNSQDGTVGGAAGGTITYYARIREQYDSETSGSAVDTFVDQSDVFNNVVTIAGMVYTGDPDLPATLVSGDQEADGSAASFAIATGTVTKYLYAINGLDPVLGSDGKYHMQPGDVVSYRLQYTLPTSDFESFKLDDYLPLPVLDVDDVGVWSFDGAGTRTTSSATAPISGHVRLMGSDTFTTYSSLIPTITADSNANSVTFAYPEYHSTTTETHFIDLVFSVTVSDDPFADGLYLTNQVRASEGGTPGPLATVDQIVQIVLDEPVLDIIKGVIATSNAGGQFDITPGDDSNLSRVDAGDTVTYQIRLENSGHAPAFNIKLNDALPTGYTDADVVGGSFHVRDGNGRDILYTGTVASFFGAAGIELTGYDKDGDGAADDGDGLGTIDGDVGENTILITYTLNLNSNLQPLQILTNTASLTHYAGSETGIDHTVIDLTDAATVTGAQPTIAKTLVETGVAINGNNLANQATIGEYVTYTITLTVPEGTMGQADTLDRGVILRDTLDAGLAFVDVTAVSASTGLTFSGLAGTGLPSVGTSPDNTLVSTFSGQDGRQITFNLGQITNANNSNGSPETVQITYRAIVLNTAANQAGLALNNNLDIDWDNDSGIQDLTDVSAENITIVEPTLSTGKLVRNFTDLTAYLSTVPADTGDIIDYQITITNPNGPGDTTAFDISLSDIIPAALGAPAITGVSSSGIIKIGGITDTPDAADFQVIANTLTINPAINIDMEKNSSITITVRGTFTGATGDLVPNTAEVRWTSMDGSVVDASGHNGDSDERDGSDGFLSSGLLNNYRQQSTANIELPSLVYKTIVATSEVSTAQTTSIAADAAIGEIVRYRLYASIGEGNTDNFQIRDNLPTGMQFLNDGTARWAFIASSSGNLASSTISPGGNAITGLGSATTVVGDGSNLASLISSSITGTFNDNNIASAFNISGTGEAAIYSSGQDVYFRFGDLVNLDNDGDLEFVVVEFNALVANIAGNQAATTRANNFTLLADTQLSQDGIPGYISVMIDSNGDGVRSTGETMIGAVDANNNAGSGTDTQAWSNSATVRVVEPQVNIDKSVTATTGTEVTYRLVLTNTGTAATTAFNTQVTDALDPATFTLLNPAGISAVSAGGASVAANTSAGNTVSFTIDSLPVGGSITITYSATIVATAPSNLTTLNNTATTTWTSLPGELGSGGSWTGDAGTSSIVPGSSGGATGERTGSGGVNDYIDTDTERLGSLGDRVFFDQDGDGMQDAGEAGLVGVTVTVRWEGPDGSFGTIDDSIITTITGTDGAWVVSGLPVGTGRDYRVSVPASLSGMAVTDVQDNGGIANANPTGLGVGIGAITLSGTSADTSNNRLQDFGYRGSASLGNRVYIDADTDGVQDSNGLEPNLPGVTLSLTWAGFDGIFGNSDDIVLTTISSNPASPTAPNYLFQYLPAGDFIISTSAIGGIGGVPENMLLTDSVDNGSLDASATVGKTLALGENDLTIDFGYQGDSAIGDLVWYDADGDGTQDSGATSEPGIAGANVTLLWAGPDGAFGGGDDVSFTTTTDADGKYLFSGLPVNGPSDQYRVTVTPPAAYPSQTHDRDGLATANESSLDLALTSTDLDQDFGYRGTTTATAQLGNLVWEDINGNGVQDTGEPGIAGISVDLFFAGFDGVFQDYELNTALLTTSTASDGSYFFDSLAAGTYRLRFGTSDGSISYARSVSDSPIANDTTDSDGNQTTGYTADYILIDAESNITVDQGLYRPVSLGDRVYYDLNADGIQDAGEPGIGNIPMQVIWLGPDGSLGGGDDLTYTTTTGGDGSWTISDLPPGMYQVTAQPAANVGYQITDSLDDGIVNTLSQVLVSTTSGNSRDDIDFGFRGLGSIGDRIWNDSNRNGRQDGSEAGISGVEITIGIDLDGDGSSDLTISATTDSGGNYLFPYLPAGTHTLTVNPATIPDDLSLSYDPDRTLDGTTRVNLGAGEIYTAADFGYAPPEEPIIIPPTETSNRLPIDPYFWKRIFGSKPTGLDDFLSGPSLFAQRDPIYQDTVLPVSPIYSGHAEPGTTITLNLYDVEGNHVGYQTVMADSAGNWMANFSGIQLTELPHMIEIDQTISALNDSTAGAFNMRTYFTPTFGAAPFTKTNLSVDSIFASLPHNIFESMKENLEQPLQLGWNDFNGYEFFAPSTNPAKNHL